MVRTVMRVSIVKSATVSAPSCTINYGGMGQLSKLPGYRPVTECHRGNVILDLNSD